MNCPYCGAQNKDGAKFCRMCARRILAEDPAGSRPNVETEPVEDEEPVEYAEPKKATSGRGRKTVFVVIVAALAVGGGAWFYLTQVNKGAGGADTAKIAAGEPAPPDLNPSSPLPPASAPVLEPSPASPPALSAPTSASPPELTSGPPSALTSEPPPGVTSAPSADTTTAPPLALPSMPPHAETPASPPALTSAPPPTPLSAPAPPDLTSAPPPGLTPGLPPELPSTIPPVTQLPKPVPTPPTSKPPKAAAAKTDVKKKEPAKGGKPVATQEQPRESVALVSKPKQVIEIPKTLTIKKDTALRHLPSSEPAFSQPSYEEPKTATSMVEEMRACASKALFAKLLCEDQVRAKYCPGKWGTRPECPTQRDITDRGE